MTTDPLLALLDEIEARAKVDSMSGDIFTRLSPDLVLRLVAVARAVIENEPGLRSVGARNLLDALAALSTLASERRR